MALTEKKLRIHDVSIPIYPGMVKWIDDQDVELKREASITNGDAYNLSRLTCSVHTGTHIDAPYHFTAEGNTVDRLSLHDLIGEALVVQIDPDTITAAELHDIDFTKHKSESCLRPEIPSCLHQTRLARTMSHSIIPPPSSW